MADSSKLPNRRQTLNWLGAGAALTWHPSFSLAQAPAGRTVSTDAVTPEVARSIQAGLAFLVTKQNADGSFGTGAYGRNVAVTSLCAMALVANGSSPGRGPYGGIINRAIGYIQGQSSESGFINHPESTNRGPMYGHGFATLFLAEMYGMSLHPHLRNQLAKATALIVATQNEAGGWRYQPRRDDADLSVTVCQLMALRAARNAGVFVPNATVDRAVEYVKGCQNQDGGFTYRVGDGGDSAFPRSAALRNHRTASLSNWDRLSSRALRLYRLLVNRGDGLRFRRP
jgi:prenyltransferase beta subunit